MTTQPDADDLQRYCDAIRALQTGGNKARITFTKGYKLARIIMEEGNPETTMRRSVHSFVDLATGDILMAESWAKPAKTARGNVFRLEAGGFNEHGAAFLR